MTREENIKAILETCFAGYKEELIDAAVKNIIALKEEPCDDLRKYINALRKCAKEHEKDDTPTFHIIVSDLCNDTADLLENVKREPCEDAVSRQAVKEEMIKYGFRAPDMTVTEFVEDMLQPVTPKIEARSGFNENAVDRTIKESEQEPIYCDRNICVSNEYNSIGCEECEVTKSQEKISEPCECVDLIDRGQAQTEIEEVAE